MLEFLNCSWLHCIRNGVSEIVASDLWLTDMDVSMAAADN